MYRERVAWFGAFDGIDVTTRDAFRWLTLLAATPVVFLPPRRAVLRRGEAPRPGATVGNGHPGGAGGRAHLPRQRNRGRRQRPRRLVRVGQHVRRSSSVSVATPRKCARGTAIYDLSRRAGAGDWRRVRRSRGAQRRADARVGAIPSSRPAIASIVADQVRRFPPKLGDARRSTDCRVDEALLCGESAPVAKRRGDALCAGSVVTGRPATVRVSRVGADTRSLSGIVSAHGPLAATTRPRLAARRALPRRSSSHACCSSPRARPIGLDDRRSAARFLRDGRGAGRRMSVRLRAGRRGRRPGPRSPCLRAAAVLVNIRPGLRSKPSPRRRT